jgi:hypothetical protein
MFGRRILNAAIVVALTAAPAAAQSLGELSRQEEARRAEAKKAVKTLTNADLGPGGVAAPAAAAAAPAESTCYMSRSKGVCVSAEEMLAASVAGASTKENAPLEQRYRSEAEAIRSQIEKTHATIATLEGVIADDTRSVTERKSADKALASARQNLAGLERNWAKLETAVNNQHFPHKWIEPVPALTKQ